MANILRFFEIIRVLAKHGVLNFLSDVKLVPKSLAFICSCFFVNKIKKSLNERIRLALQELGPTFIKFGQFLSTRVDLIGEELAGELSGLQDSVKPSIGKDVYSIIEKEFAQGVHELFKSFDGKPVASASIAEVFIAKTNNNKRVAVKVLRPGVEKRFASDISLFYRLVSFIEDRNKKYQRLKLKEVVKLFESTVNTEMDLRFDAASASELKENCYKDRGVYIPEVHWKLVSRRVLTMEWVTGTSIYDVKELKKKKVNLKKVGRNLICMFLNQAYRDGFFHADLHPGNVLVKDNGDIILLDFGIMGRLDKKTKVYLAEILKGFIERDYNAVAEVHQRAGYISRNVSVADFAQACRSIGEPIVGVSTEDISIAQLLTHLFKVTEDFNMEVQPQLVLIQKTTIMIEGLIALLDAKINMWKEAEPWIKKWADDNLRFDSRVLTRIEEFKDMLEERLSCGNSPYIVKYKTGRGARCIVMLLFIIILIMLYRC